MKCVEGETLVYRSEIPLHERHPPGPVVVVELPAGVYVNEISTYPVLHLNPGYKINPGPDAAP